MKPDPIYTVNVFGVGTVYSGCDRLDALDVYNMHVGHSKAGLGRSAYHSVIMFENEVVAFEHRGADDDSVRS